MLAKVAINYKVYVCMHQAVERTTMAAAAVSCRVLRAAAMAG
jgi:hypothetical protein